MVDHLRSAVYAAEHRAFEGTDLEDLAEFGRVAARIQSVATGEWWPGPAVEVLRSRVDAASSSTRCATLAEGGTATIRLAGSQTTVATAAHELAHALAGVGAGHGPVFRVAYLDVIAVMTNADSTDRRHELHVGQLARAFAEDGLSVGDRRWPQPPMSTTSAIAL